MTESATQFVGEIPAIYDAYLVPQIFQDYAADLAARAGAIAPGRVLELAAGTGVVTRLLRDMLPSAELTVSDLNRPMLEYAKRKFGDHDAPLFEIADATALPFDDGAFDLAVCQFGVMFFPDKERSYKEVCRILTPGGTYLFNVWDSMDANPFARIVYDATRKIFKSDPPGFMHVPFGYYDVDAIGAALNAAGFDRVSYDRVTVDKEIISAENFARGLVFGNPLIEEIRARGTPGPEAVMRAIRDALEAAFGKDPGRMPLEAIVFKAERD